MTLDYDCPHCKVTMSVGRETAGQEIVCPGCRVVLKLPTPLRMTKREARSRLLPFAIFLSVEGAVYLMICVAVPVTLVFRYLENGAQDITGELIVPSAICGFAMFPGLVMLVGAWALFRAEHRVLIAIGMFTGGLVAMCCCFPVVGFAFWLNPGAINDPVLHQAIDSPE